MKGSPRKSFRNPHHAIPASDAPAACAHGNGIPDGPTERHKLLKENFLKQVPSISIHRARVITRIDKENPGLPKIELRAKAFRRCCETAPLVIQDNELIVGCPCGGPAWEPFPRTSPGAGCATSWTPSPTVLRTPSMFPKKTKRFCAKKSSPTGKASPWTNTAKPQYREAGVWELSGESFVSDCSYHALNGGGDSNPGYDVLLMKRMAGYPA